MKARNFAVSLLAASALASALLLTGCSSDSGADDPNAPAKKSESTSSKASDFFKAIDAKLDKSRIKDDNADMYRFKNSDNVIFHKERRSDSLLEKNGSIDPNLLDK